MKCRMCGQREATIHLLELINGQQKSVWLCSICAAERADLALAGRERPDGDGADDAAGESQSLASFLGQNLDVGGRPTVLAACPTCGYEIKSFQDSNRLGCSGCYPHFRDQVLPILARYHRHATHLGKVPRRAGQTANRRGELTRLRVDLEKAIQSEAYEEAARLRDAIRNLLAEYDQLKDAVTDDEDGS